MKIRFTNKLVADYILALIYVTQIRIFLLSSYLLYKMHQSLNI